MDDGKKTLNNSLFQELLKEGMEIQDRFAAEPIFGPTGKGHLKSAGVKELAEIKKRKAEKKNGAN